MSSYFLGGEAEREEGEVLREGVEEQEEERMDGRGGEG